MGVQVQRQAPPVVVTPIEEVVLSPHHAGQKRPTAYDRYNVTFSPAKKYQGVGYVTINYSPALSENKNGQFSCTAGELREFAHALLALAEQQEG